MPVFKTATAILLPALMALWLSACAPKPHLEQTGLFAFGTLVDITISSRDPELFQRATEAIGRDLEYMHYAWHAWHPGPLGRINMLLEATGTFTANPSVLPLIIESKRLSRLSQGLFNPAIGHLIHRWGFQSDLLEEDRRPPADQEIQKLLALNPGMEDIHIKHTQVHSQNAAVKLDFGAVAKGYALDRIMEHLRELGVRHAIVNAGGDLKAIGRHPERPWHVGIRHPRREEGIIAALDVHDQESVFTSGDYERYFKHEGKRYHHIIDPRNGYPATGCQSVTVITRSGTLADAAATALFIAGPQQWPEIAKSMGIEYVLLIDDQGRMQATPKMLKRLQLPKGSAPIQTRTLP